MDESGVRQGLVNILREKRRPVWEHMQANANISYAEYLQRIELTRPNFEQYGIQPPTMTEPEFEAHRRDQRARLTEAGFESFVAEEADALLPHLLLLREEQARNGHVTEDEVYEASFRRSQVSLDKAIGIVKDRYQNESNPRKRAVLEQFIPMVELDRQALNRLHGNLSEATLETTSDEIVGRMNKLTELMRSRDLE